MREVCFCEETHFSFIYTSYICRGTGLTQFSRSPTSYPTSHNSRIFHSSQGKGTASFVEKSHRLHRLHRSHPDGIPHRMASVQSV